MPAIGQPVQGYYYDQTTDTLRPIAAQASTVDLPGRHRYTTTVPPDIVDGQLWLDSDAPYTPTSQVPVFTNNADRDAQWTSPPNGAMCVTLDTYTIWLRQAGVWVSRAHRAIGCALSLTGATSVPNATFHPLPWDFEDDDADGMHTSGVPTRITIPAGLGGRWLFTYSVGFQANSTGTRSAFFRVDGAAADRRGMSAGIPSASADAVLAGSHITRIVAGSYVDCMVYQTSGAALSVMGNATAGFYTSFAAARLGD